MLYFFKSMINGLNTNINMLYFVESICLRSLIQSSPYTFLNMYFLYKENVKLLIIEIRVKIQTKKIGKIRKSQASAIMARLVVNDYFSVI